MDVGSTPAQLPHTKSLSVYVDVYGCAGKQWYTEYDRGYDLFHKPAIKNRSIFQDIRVGFFGTRCDDVVQRERQIFTTAFPRVALL